MDKSFASKGTLTRHRNVLTRAERIETLKDQDLWKEDSRPVGLPKVGHRKVTMGKKDKVKKDEETTETDETADTKSDEKK